MPHVTEAEFNQAAACLVKRKEAWKSHVDHAEQSHQSLSHSDARRTEGSEFEIIAQYLTQRAQIATTMGDQKIFNACNQLVKEVSKVKNDVASCDNWHQVMHEMNMLELDLRYFCAVTNEGRTRVG